MAKVSRFVQRKWIRPQGRGGAKHRFLYMPHQPSLTAHTSRTSFSLKGFFLSAGSRLPNLPRFVLLPFTSVTLSSTLTGNFGAHGVSLRGKYHGPPVTRGENLVAIAKKVSAKIVFALHL